MTKYLAYSVFLHTAALAIFLFKLLSAPPTVVYYGIDFMGGGASGQGMAKNSAGAPAPLEEVKEAPPAPPTVEEPPLPKMEDRILAAKKKDAPKAAPPKTGAAAKVGKTKAAASSSAAKKEKGGTGKGGAGGSGTTLEIGGGGPGGGAGFDARFPYAWYINLMYKKLWEAWDRSDADTRQCTVAFTVQKDGELKDIEVDKSSGDSLFDMMAQRAVSVSSPFPPLPDGYSKPTLRVYVRFKNDL